MRLLGSLHTLPEPALTVRAWAQIKNDGTKVIYGSHNVSSVTDNGLGDTTVTWAKPMASASSYAALCCVTNGKTAPTQTTYNLQSITANSVQTSNVDYNAASAADSQRLYVAAIGEY
jgi:hypothetical protein